MFFKFVKNFVQNLKLSYLETYPKFSSITFLDIELQQKCVKLSLNFHSKSISQKYGHTL
jgi:predicted transport protein